MFQILGSILRPIFGVLARRWTTRTFLPEARSLKPEALLLFAIFVAACGLAPAPDPASSPIGDGTAPWEAAGGTTMCLGDLAFAPPEDPVGGFCQSPLTPPTGACTADADCGSRQTCLCGRCVVGYCNANSDCADGRTCDFTTNRCDHACTADGVPDCAAGEQCISGLCRGRCADSSECQHGEVCDRTHVCITDNCVDGSECFPGETCEIQRIPRQVREPAPMYLAPAGKTAGDNGPGTIVLYFDLADPATPTARSIYRAISADARHFVVSPQTPVIANAQAPSPVALADGSIELLYEQAGAIVEATSLDGGVTFTGATPIATGASPGAVQLSAAGDLAVYYQRPDGTLGLARGAVGTAAALADAGEVLAPADVEVGDASIPDSAFWTPVTRLATPSAILAGPEGTGIAAAGATVHLYFSAFGRESGDAVSHGSAEAIPPNYSVGYAAAPIADPAALAVWPYGPVADHVEVFTEHHDELDPAAVRTNAGWRLYYIDATRDPGVDEAGPFHLGRLVVLAGAEAGAAPGQ